MPASGRWIRRRGFTFEAAARPVLCRGRKAAGDHPEPLAPGSAADRRDHDRADPVRGRHHAVPRARDRPPRGGRGEARGTRDDRRADRAEEPAQVRYRDRSGVASRGAQQDRRRGVDDRCGPFQSLQRQLWPPGRRPGAGRHRDLHFGLGAAVGRLPGAVRRRGIRGAVAGPLGGGSVRRRRNHPPARSSIGRRIPASRPSASAWRA